MRASIIAGLSWRPLAESDLTALTRLASDGLAADGGQPYAADVDFLRGCYLAGAEGLACFDGATAVTTGLVHPAWRRHGIGGRAFDWACARAAGANGATGVICAETETFNDGPPPGGLVLSQWGRGDPARFYAVYTAAFSGRPGFPGWSLERWSKWISDDEDFRADWTLLATVSGADVAFIAGAAGGWIVQLGVVPAARGQGLGAYLTGEAVGRMRSAGESTVTLNVNANNPHAAALYRRLGFAPAGRRARYVSRP